MPGLLDKNRILSVGQLSDILKEVLQSELFMNIRVRGEIVSKQVKGGNVYLTLIDPEDSNLPPNKKATLRAIVFSYYQRSIVSTYNEGDQVIVRGDLSYYPPFGTISFIAKDLIEEGEGNELLKLKRLEEKLEKEGLFASERKRPLPKTVRKIGIITSASGAAYHDIMQTLSKKVPVNTVLFDAVVQGENAPASLIRALDKAYKSDIDVLIFGRGGGSKTDLSCFNDEKVVRKLAESPVPVVTGIGHEIDRSLCDLAADVYAITPTAAAEAVLPDEQAVRDDLSLKKKKLDDWEERYATSKALELVQYEKALESYSPSNRILKKQSNLSEKKNALKNAFLNRLYLLEKDLNGKAVKLNALNPLIGLTEGKGIVRLNGKTVESVYELNKGDSIEIGMRDGIVLSEVKDVFKGGQI